ncbi:Arc family DNA-binding protein [Sphingobium sp. YR768]|uniref:Arc family DNA-binding protein n=1 Tax=Sphingobium sp. YR768 TaxID=1884365 RepID=UPI0008CE5D86|nr:Arc family DNA-binding protein [Sphingobium sp. YR768]SES08681.1 Arc-like DNA binding domain-containing protein [Sphingobium sp. YR768]
MSESEKRIAPFGLRLPPALKARVQKSADDANRSLNAEIIARLESSFEGPSREEYDAMKKWTQDILKTALDVAVEQIIAEKDTGRGE